MLTPPTVADLAGFTGRAEASYDTFATTALSQAALLLSLVTSLTDYPDNADQAQLARNAIMEMAERIDYERAYAQVKASPFQSETIGSYSYAKASTVYKARHGDHTGMLWWDLALDELRDADRSDVTSGAIHVVEPAIHATVDDTEDRFILGPADAAHIVDVDRTS